MEPRTNPAPACDAMLVKPSPPADGFPASRPAGFCPGGPAGVEVSDRSGRLPPLAGGVSLPAGPPGRLGARNAGLDRKIQVLSDPAAGYKSKYYINRPRILMPRQIEVQRKVEVEGGGKISKTRHLGPKPDLNGRNSV